MAFLEKKKKISILNGAESSWTWGTKTIRLISPIIARKNRKCLTVDEFSRVDSIKQLSILLIARSENCQIKCFRQTSKLNSVYNRCIEVRAIKAGTSFFDNYVIRAIFLLVVLFSNISIRLIAEAAKWLDQLALIARSLETCISYVL